MVFSSLKKPFSRLKTGCYHRCLLRFEHNLLAMTSEPGHMAFVSLYLAVGDNVLLLSLLDQYVRENPATAIDVFLFAKNLERYKTLYPVLSKVRLHIQKESITSWVYRWERQWVQFESAHHDRVFSNHWDIQNHSDTVIGLAKKHLGLSKDPLDGPVIVKPSSFSLSSFGISDPHQTILLNASSFSTQSESVKKTLEACARSLSNQGFHVFMNVVGDESPLPFTQPLRCSFEEFYLISLQTKCLISLRSGLLDFVASSFCPIVCLYDEKPEHRFLYTDMPLSMWQRSAPTLDLLNGSDSLTQIEAFVSKLSSR
jgi:hypothetical protein